MHRLGGFNEEACQINFLIKKNNELAIVPTRSDLAWKPDYKHVAIGNEDGSIHILSAPFLQIVCSVHIHSKYISCLSWHHNFTGTAQAEGMFLMLIL